MSLSPDLAPVSRSLPRRKWWTTLQAGPEAAVRLWCFPCVGAGAAMWRTWVPVLEDAAELVSVSLPGREGRFDEAPFTALNDLASVLAAEIAPFSDARDVFCGHDFGALLACEVARRLRERGAASPRGLIVCGAPSPDRPWPGPALHRLSEREFITAVERYYGPIPPEFRHRQEFLELLLPALRADLEAVETYRSPRRPPLAIPLLALAGDRDALVPARLLSGWRSHTTGRFQGATVAGGHFFVTENAGDTAARVRNFLAQL